MRVESKVLHSGERVLREEGVAGRFYIAYSAVALFGLTIGFAVVNWLFTYIDSLTGMIFGGGPGPLMSAIGMFGPIAFLICLVMLGIELLRAYGYGYALTDQRLVVREGIFAMKCRSADLSRLQDATVKQTFIERLLGLGTVVVETAGTEGALKLGAVNRPYEWVEQMRAAANTGVSAVFEAAPATPVVPAVDYFAPVTQGGWHPDPFGRAQLRYYDGSKWTEHIQNAGAPGIDAPNF